MPTVWLDFVNPVVTSTDPNANQGAVVGTGSCLTTADGDTSYVSLSNGYQLEPDRDGGYSRTFSVDLVPDPTLPPIGDTAEWDIRWVLDGRVETAGGTVNVSRIVPSGFETIGSFSSTGHVTDVPRGSKASGPSWDDLRGDTTGWPMEFRGQSRILLPGDIFTFARVTRMRLMVTYTLASGDGGPVDAGPLRRPRRSAPSLRMLQRGGSGGMSGIPRMVGDPTRRGIRQGPGSIY